MELPYNIEAEKQVLANMLFSNDALVESFSRLSEDDFYDKNNRIIFKAMKEISDANDAKVEPYALIDKLSIEGKLEEVGDAPYILELANSFHDIANAKYYISSVEEKSTLRKLILVADNVTKKWQSESSGDISNYINKIEKDVTDITKNRRVEDFISAGEAFRRFRTNIAQIRSGQDRVQGLATGYNTYDRIMMGFKAGEVTILAARPSVGKSALALNFLYRVAMRTQKPCVFFSLEMGIEQVVNRILSASSSVNITKLQTGSFNKEDEEAINKSMREISNSNLFIDETPGIKVSEIRAKLNKLKSKFGDMGLVVIDYIGLITPDVRSRKSDSRSLELGEISAAIHALARDFKCPILALSQLNRGVDQGSKINNPPQLSNLRESGNLEQDADVVLFIHRPDYGQQKESENSENANQSDEDNSPVSLIVAKNRNGRLATIEFMFQKHLGKFVEMDVNR